MLKLQASTVLHIFFEFYRITAAEFVESRLQLLLLNVFVLLVLIFTRKILPREATSQEIQHHMANRLEIVATRLFLAHVGRKARVTSRTRQVFAFNKWYMLALTILVALCKTEIDNVNVVLGQISASEQEVVGLDVSVNDSLIMNFLKALDHLLRDQAASLQVELSLTLHEKVFETGP